VIYDCTSTNQTTQQCPHTYQNYKIQQQHNITHDKSNHNVLGVTGCFTINLTTIISLLISQNIKIKEYNNNKV